MHDRNGTPVKKGDIVVIKARIKDVTGGVDYCNATLEVGYEAEHGPANVTGSIVVNTRQTLLLETSKVES